MKRIANPYTRLNRIANAAERQTTIELQFISSGEFVICPR